MSSSTGCRCLPVSFITIVFIAAVTLQPLFPVAFSTNPSMIASQPEGTVATSHLSAASFSDVSNLPHLEKFYLQSTNAVGFPWKHAPYRAIRSLRNVRRRSLDRYHRDGSSTYALPVPLSTCSQAPSTGARPPCDINRAKTSKSPQTNSPPVPLVVIEVCEACGQYWESIIGLNYCCRCNDKVFQFCLEAYVGYNSLR